MRSIRRIVTLLAVVMLRVGIAAERERAATAGDKEKARREGNIQHRTSNDGGVGVDEFCGRDWGEEMLFGPGSGDRRSEGGVLRCEYCGVHILALARRSFLEVIPLHFQLCCVFGLCDAVPRNLNKDKWTKNPPKK